MKVEDELRKIRMLLEAQTKASGILSYVNQYVVGRNEGGGYIRVFSSHLGFSVGAIYENKFHELPDLPEWKTWIESVKQEIVGRRAIKAPITEKEDAVDRKALKDLPSPLMVVFYQFSNAEKKKKNFGGVYAVLPKITQKDTESPQPELSDSVFDPQVAPVFNSKDEALKWAVNMTLYSDVNGAEIAFNSMKTQLAAKLGNQLNSAVMFTNWIAHVRETVKLIEQSEGKR